MLDAPALKYFEKQPLIAGTKQCWLPLRADRLARQLGLLDLFFAWYQHPCSVEVDASQTNVLSNLPLLDIYALTLVCLWALLYYKKRLFPG